MSSSEEEKVPDEVHVACLRASAAGDLDGLRKSVEAGAEIGSRDGEGLTPLMLAANAGKADCVEFLLTKGAKPNLQSYVVERRRPGHFEACSRLEMQIGIVRQVGCKFTALHLAVSSGSAETVDALLKTPSLDVNLQSDDRDGNRLTPLHIAAALGMEVLVKSLLAAPGINVNLITRCDNAALDLARSPVRRISTLELLGKEAFPPDFQEAGPAYPGIAALIEGAGGKTCADLGDERALQEAEGFERYRQSMEACGGPDEFFEEAQGLAGKLAAIKLGADVNLKAPRRLPPLLRASYFTCRTLTRALVEAGADIHVTNGEGVTALHIAVREGMPDTIEYLLAQGADVNAKSDDGRTPLDYTTFPELVYVLKQAGAVRSATAEKDE
eukprot:TRINITY_DN14374_c0_g1_i1.p1 TRINITY_DN14374_c0_g1~~TRINITY_DN14374_c0_g1_i1.p1  ORF type:complete len:385 (-),score=94.68 TRINITY_DN14374_c0_g1_i1:498-1652(-)